MAPGLRTGLDAKQIAPNFEVKPRFHPRPGYAGAPVMNSVNVGEVCVETFALDSSVRGRGCGVGQPCASKYAAGRRCISGTSLLPRSNTDRTLMVRSRVNGQ